MAQVLIRDLDPRTVATLKKRAKKNKRSLQGEVKLILEEAARASTPLSLDEFLVRAAAIRKKTSAKIKSDSADLIREDRER
jgi:plasmid stability protein